MPTEFTKADEAQNEQINQQGKKEQSLEARVAALEDKLKDHSERLDPIEVVLRSVKKLLGIKD